MRRRALEIVLDFTRRTGHEHPHLHDAIGSYARLLVQMGRTPEQVGTAVDDLLEGKGASFDMKNKGKKPKGKTKRETRRRKGAK